MMPSRSASSRTIGQAPFVQFAMTVYVVDVEDRVLANHQVPPARP